MDNLTLNIGSNKTQTFKAGEILIQERTLPSCVYILKEGSVLVVSGQTVLATLDTPGTILGEIAYMFDYHHTASVIADTEITVYKIEDFHNFLKKNPENIQKICRMMQLRLMNTGQKGFENRPLDLQLSGCNIETFSKDSVVIKEGNSGTKIYILRDGMIKAISGDSVIYRGNTSGMMFGEITTLIQGRYGISLVAITDCSFYVVDDMQEFFKSNPAACLRISQFLAKRLTTIVDRFSEFKAEVMRKNSQLGKNHFASSLVEFDEQVSLGAINPFSNRR